MVPPVRVIGAALTATLALTALGAGPALALPDDREQPIHITADKAVRDEKRGVTIYSGNVEMRQGSLELDADSLTIFHEAEDADKIIARGAPAKMRQQPEIDSGIVNAHAEEITYLRRSERVNLRSGAHLERDDGTLVTGDSIDYFIVQQVVRAESDTTNADNKVVVVIPPSVHQGEDTDQPPMTITPPAPEATAPEEGVPESAAPQAGGASQATTAGTEQAGEALPATEAGDSGGAESE
jgi:lipopolysaccharide export system protein LptA